MIVHYENEETLLKRKRELLQELDRINNKLKNIKNPEIKKEKTLIKTIPMTKEEFAQKLEKLKDRDIITVIVTGNLEYQERVGDKILYSVCNTIEQVAWCLYGFVVNSAYESVLDIY
ncbi:hypothetical protein [Clostridium beijerinckii]|uniref:hypothetical protein n=1 Tax=Clostridium beijerinckii TaxID=1520 RepID=UPI00156E9F2D|nr:hypothetical protein [Clostridium beijerinckii]NRU52486.1 uncharacterized protein with von Willebrand factor type A (vWA) domain [Clostridium beijerinckii]NYC69069.1 uncharacterized protein with von Willebrand factor type A (vWA) domain [Clostridium beijerinckii]NYC91687.1 uncharacterized protein with von Willebrand factor type A (vWA) domain [Clostridium beijerinckii]